MPMEAALSLGLSPWRVFVLVRLPLALRAIEAATAVLSGGATWLGRREGLP